MGKSNQDESGKNKAAVKRTMGIHSKVAAQEKASTAAEKQFFVPDEGPVKISCTDDKGRNRDIWITVKYVNL